MDSPSWAIMSVVAMIVAIVVANVVVVAVEDLGWQFCRCCCCKATDPTVGLLLRPILLISD